MSADVAIVSVFTYILPVLLQFLLYYANLNNSTWYIYHLRCFNDRNGVKIFIYSHIFAFRIVGFCQFLGALKCPIYNSDKGIQKKICWNSTTSIICQLSFSLYHSTSHTVTSGKTSSYRKKILQNIKMVLLCRTEYYKTCTVQE